MPLTYTKRTFYQHPYRSLTSIPYLRGMKLMIEIPDNAATNENEMKRMLAAKLYESGKLSLGDAAQVAGMSKTEFTERLDEYNVSTLNSVVSSQAINASIYDETYLKELRDKAKQSWLGNINPDEWLREIRNGYGK